MLTQDAEVTDHIPEAQGSSLQETKATDIPRWPGTAPVRRGQSSVAAKPNKLFWLLLVFPNFVSVVYYLILASPIYVSTASLTVTNPGQNASSLTSILSGAAGDGSTQGAYIISEYIASWEAFRRATGLLDVDEAFRQGDIVSRYGGLATLGQTSDVALWHYYQKNVTVSVDAKSGISELNVYGYDPAFATSLAETVLGGAVERMNEMNQKQEADYVGYAESSKKEMQDAITADDRAIAGYRAEIGVFDPKEEYTANLALLNLTVS